MYYPREAQRDFLFTRAAMLFFVTLVLALMLFLSKGRGAPYALIKAAPMETTGQVTQVEDIGNWGAITNVYYRFKYEDQNEEGMVSTSNYADSPVYEVGSPVQVVYSKWFPEVHNIKENLSKGSWNFYIMSFSAALIVLCQAWMFWTLRQIYRHKEEDRSY
ncbi:DUF3592 domain-containing protein [Pseudomonas trivialis]|uniref:DUF3592 domain-containing protein n=1 Tax=Pseudomonas trivialis TaxID=200450 RepID=UPI0030CD03CF